MWRSRQWCWRGLGHTGTAGKGKDKGRRVPGRSHGQEEVEPWWPQPACVRSCWQLGKVQERQGNGAFEARGGRRGKGEAVATAASLCAPRSTCGGKVGGQAPHPSTPTNTQPAMAAAVCVLWLAGHRQSGTRKGQLLAGGPHSVCVWEAYLLPPSSCRPVHLPPPPPQLWPCYWQNHGHHIFLILNIMKRTSD